MNLQVHRLILTWLAAVAVGCHAVDGAAAAPPAGPAWAWNLAVRFPNTTATLREPWGFHEPSL